jgi:hypothetical protein
MNPKNLSAFDIFLKQQSGTLNLWTLVKQDNINFEKDASLYYVV